MNKIYATIIFVFLAINLHAQSIDFTFTTSNGFFCNPSTITFTQNCTGNPTSFIWDFGNGTFGDQAVHSASYTSAGSYTVKLVVIFANTTLSLTKVVVINPAGTAVIAVDRNYICQPGVINFTGSGNGNITNYDWDFGDTSAIADVSYAAINHSYLYYGNKTVTLKTTNDAGCMASATANISIKKLPVAGTVSRNNGCVPATVNFKSAVSVPQGSFVNNYLWDYGDGSPVVSNTSGATSQTYTAVGQYLPKVTVTTNEGCTNTFNYNSLAFGTPPTGLKTSVQQNPICGSDSAVFQASAINANAYAWNFGDTTTANIKDTIVAHKYNFIGNKTATVIPYFNGCPAPKATILETVIGVIAKFSYANVCAKKATYVFTNNTSGIPTGYLWTLGDNTLPQFTPTVVHTFPTSGQFTVKLVTFDTVAGCRDSISKIVYTAVPALFTADTAICRNSPISFSLLNNYTNSAASYTWNIVGITGVNTNAANVTVNAINLGNFTNNNVIINNGTGVCPDTILLNRPILVRGIILDFTAPAKLCFNTIYTITNNSKPSPSSDSVSVWYWNYGVAIKNDSIYQPAPFKYANAGSYNVKLIGIDNYGCKDSLIKNVSINPLPIVHISPNKNVLCFGLSDTLFVFHSGSVMWTPAYNLSCTVCDTAMASPKISTTYYATATNTFNCTNQDSIFISVSIPFTAAITPAAAAICQQQTIMVAVTPKGKRIIWSPTTGLSDPTIYNPVFTGVQSTVYTATLNDSSGCISNSSTATFTLTVKSLPVVNAGPDATYPRGTNFLFTPTYSSNVSSYLWTPSDQLSCSKCAVPAGVVTHTQTYALQVVSDSGCVASDSVTIFVECKYSNLFMPKAFSPNNDNLNDYFYPITVGIKTITKFIIFNRHGQIMFQANNFSPNDRNFGWDGRFRGEEQAVGTYVFVLEALCDIGEKLFKKDSFVLVR